MIEVGAYEAKTRLAALLDKVQQGEEVTITRHRVPIARLIPSPQLRQQPVEKTITELREFRKTRKLGNCSIREMIDEGRRG